MPFRPVAVTLGKTVNNGWGGFECCWARTLLATLVGALEVPGGTIGTTVRLTRPMSQRHDSVKPGPDGFMYYPLNPTDKATWSPKPNIRNAYRTMVPLAADGPWSQALGPTHFSWMFMDETPKGLPRVTPPDVWFVYRTNPAISFWDTEALGEKMARFPFVVAFAYTRDETNHFADVLLPDATDLESLQLIRIGGTKYVEQFWDHEGFALRQPVVAPRGEARDFTDIATELARRTGLTSGYNAAINKGAAGVPLRGEHADYSLELEQSHGRDAIWDAVCRAASAELTRRRRVERPGLVEGTRPGHQALPARPLVPASHPGRARPAFRDALPGAAAARRRRARAPAARARHALVGRAAGGIPGAAEVEGLPGAVGGHRHRRRRQGAATIPFWLLTARCMQYAWGGNVGMQMIKEVADNIAGHRGVIVNTQTAERLGIADGDPIEIATPKRKVTGRAVLRQGIRPDTLLLIGQFDHWETPLAKDFGVPSLNTLATMSMALTDATGSGADIVRVALRRGATGSRHDPLGHGRRSAPLCRLPDLHRRVQAHQRHAARGAMAARARHGIRQLPGCAARLRAGRLPALRRPAVHGRLPDHRHKKARRRHRHHRLRPVHRLRLLRGGLSLPGALQDRTRELRLRRGPTASEALRHDDERLAVATKCTFCVDRIDAGLEKGLTPGVDPAATPACVNACIAEALAFGDQDDPHSNVSQLLAENQHFRMHEELGTGPGFHYLWDTQPGGDSNMSYGPNPWQQTNWDWRAAGNFICGGAGSGLIAATALSGAQGPGHACG